MKTRYHLIPRRLTKISLTVEALAKIQGNRNLILILVAAEITRITTQGTYMAVLTCTVNLPSDAAIPTLGIDPEKFLHTLYMGSRLFVFNILIDSSS